MRKVASGMIMFSLYRMTAWNETMAHEIILPCGPGLERGREDSRVGRKHDQAGMFEDRTFKTS